MSQRQVGIIDVGSNSIKLLIAGQTGKGAIRSIRFEVEETRIGEGLAGSPPRIDPQALVKGTEAIARLLAISSEHELDALRIVATSAVREAVNREAFVDSVQLATDTELEVLSGDEEARLIGKGLRCDPKLAHLSRYSLLDLGGGSLECIQFTDGSVFQAHSLDLGAVRLTSRYVEDRNRPLAGSESELIRTHVETTFANARIERNSSPSPIAVLTGGTAAILSARHPACDARDGMSILQAHAFRKEVCSLSEPERVAQLSIPVSRADIFPAATTILCAALDYLGCEQLSFSLFNLRYGLAAEMLEDLRKGRNPLFPEPR